MEAVHVHRWTREEYERMAEVGVLAPDARVELIDGEIIERSPQKSLHAGTMLFVTEALRNAFGGAFSIRIQLPLALGDDSLPEPDFAVVSATPREQLDAHPSEAVLVVEVSDTTLAFDQGTKLCLYARNGVPEYWIVNLVDHCVEVYTEPTGELYRTRRMYLVPDRITPQVQPEAAIEVADLLP